MILFLYGPDTYRAQQKLTAIVAAYRKKDQQALEPVRVDGAETTYEALTQLLTASSFFGKGQLLVLRNIQRTPAEKDLPKRLAEFLKTTALPASNTIIFFEAGEVDKRGALYKFLKTSKNVKAQECTPPVGAALTRWATEYAATQDVALASGTAALLTAKTGDNLSRLVLEIDKLGMYIHNRPAGQRAVTTADVEALVSSRIELNIFATIDALARRDAKTALTLLHNHLHEGDNPLYLLSMVIYQFRNLLVVKDLLERGTPATDIARVAQLHPFLVQKTIPQTRAFTLATLKNIYGKLLSTDAALKSGRAEPVLALDLIAVSLTK